MIRWSILEIVSRGPKSVNSLLEFRCYMDLSYMYDFYMPIPVQFL